MALTDEQAKKLAEEINALVPKSAEVVCRDSVVDGKVVEVAEVKVHIEDRRTGNSVRWSSAFIPDGGEMGAKKIVASLKAQLAEAARRTRAAIAAERED